MSEGQDTLNKYLAYLAVALVVIGCLSILKPFVSALLWAAVICYATWPLFTKIDGICGYRRSLSAAIMTLLVALVLLMPLIVVALALADNISRFQELKSLFMQDLLPSIPFWLEKIPVAGKFLAEKWTELMSDSGKLLGYLRTFAMSSHDWFFRRLFDMGAAVFQISISVIACFFFYKDGEFIAKMFESAIRRVAGTFRQHVIATVGDTVRGVVYGIIGTAIWQGFAAGFGLWISGVPSSLLLGFITFIVSPIPLGPPIIWLCSSLWLFKHGHSGWGIFLLIWGATAVSSADNVIRTYLMSRSSRVSFVLVLLGVIGGVVHFGFIGIFLGPVLLSIGFRLLKEFCERGSSAETAS